MNTVLALTVKLYIIYRNDYPQWQPVALKNWVTHPDVDTLLSRDGNHLMDVSI